MDENKILISVPVTRKKYYDEDILKELIKDGELVYKNKLSFIKVNVLHAQEFYKEFIKMIQSDIKEYNEEKKKAETPTKKK